MAVAVMAVPAPPNGGDIDGGTGGGVGMPVPMSTGYYAAWRYRMLLRNAACRVVL